MDNFRAFEDEYEYESDAELLREEEPTMEAPPEIGADERRMHVRAYNYWVSLLDGRAYPSIEDVEPETLEDFGPHSVLLDFSAGTENPAVAFIGQALREECQLEGNISYISDVPSRSLLSRLTDHYLQIIANCAPIGFEAEFVSQKGFNTMYRGILMPLSSDGDTIDFIYGVINWKELADSDVTLSIAREVDRAAAAAPVLEATPVWADGPTTEAVAEYLPSTGSPFLDESLELGVHHDGEEAEDEDQAAFDLTLDEDAGLADRLCVARESAEAVKNADARSRTALYRALGQAYDFAIAAEASPEDYAEILEDAGLTAQERAPMTPIVKLIFGSEYDKTRLTEFAAALSYGRREGIAQGGLIAVLERSGGLKAIVQAERNVRRPEPKPDTLEQAREALRQAPAAVYIDGHNGTEEFVLLVARRDPDGRLAVVAPVAADRSLTDRAIRKAEF